MNYFSFAAFKIFSLPLAFSFFCDVSVCGSLCIYPILFEVCWTFWMGRLMLFNKLGKFPDIISFYIYFFCSFLFIFSFYLFLFLIFFGHATWLVGSQFPDQGLNPAHGNESPESWPLGHQGTPHPCLLILPLCIWAKWCSTFLWNCSFFLILFFSLFFGLCNLLQPIFKFAISVFCWFRAAVELLS